jgi:hypothetical protein
VKGQRKVVSIKYRENKSINYRDHSQLKSDQSQFLERVRQFNERIKKKQTE